MSWAEVSQSLSKSIETATSDRVAESVNVSGACPVERTAPEAVAGEAPPAAVESQRAESTTSPVPEIRHAADASGEAEAGMIFGVATNNERHGHHAHEESRGQRI
jgi:hypothetical protein